MTSFMGPMAPPPAAPAQPQALDIRTDPNQRQQFKQFMKQRTSMAPMVSAPIAQPPMPMMQPPMPMPMGQDIDIFNPVNLHEGGIVPSLNSLQQQASQFAEQLQSTVMGDSQGGGMGAGMGGGGFGGSFSSGASYEIQNGQTRPTRPELPFQDAPGGELVAPPHPITGGDFYGSMSDHPAFTSEPRPPKLSYDNDLRPIKDAQSSSENPFFGSGQQPVSYGLPGGPTYGFNDGGAVPPRNTDIRGQDHMLSYITPDEADILKALGGSGEAGPMGIPAYIGDNEGGQSSSGASEGDVGGPGADDNASDDDMGDADIGGFSGGYGDDVSSDPGSGSDADEVSDAIADIAAAEIAGQRADDRAAAAARDRAVRDAFATTTSGKPIGTKSGYLSKESATDDQVAAGYKALGLPDPNSDKASADVEASYGVPVGIASVSGVPTDRLSSNLLGFDYDLLNANIDKAIEARKGMPTQVSPLATSPFNAQNLAAAPVGLTPSDREIMGMPTAEVEALASGILGSGFIAAPGTAQANQMGTMLGLDSRPSSANAVASAPSSNVVDNFSMTPADQLEAVYGIDLDALNAAVDDPNAAMGARGPTATDAKAGIGYDPVTDMPYGLEFATNVTAPGAQISTNLAGLTEQQQKDQPLSMDIAQFIGSKPYGYEIDPKTGQVIGQIGTPPMGILGSLTNLAQNLFMGPPQKTQDLIERGAYTGMTGQDNDGIGAGGGEGSGQPVKAPTDPCPDGFVMKDGACTPIETGSDFPNQIGGMTPPTNAPAPVIVPSPRFPGYSLQGPVGYGSPIAGQAAPSVASNAAMYQQMLQGGRPPLRFEDGGAVPPRNVEISGQDHMLSYITPDEADILKALGGSGNPGPMGIPSFEDGDGPDRPTFYDVPVGSPADGMQPTRRVYIGSSQDTMENRMAGSSDLASRTQDAGPGYLPQAVNQEEYMRQYERDLAALQGRPDPYPDPAPDPVVPDPVVPDPVVDPAPTDPNAYNPIMDVVVPSTRLQDFPASAPPAFTQPMQNMQPMPMSSLSPVVSSTRPTGPMSLQGPVGYGSPIAGQGPGNINPLLSGAVNPLYSNALNFQNMLNQPFPLKLQQGGAVSSNLDMAADNFLKALMPAA